MHQCNATARRLMLIHSDKRDKGVVCSVFGVGAAVSALRISTAVAVSAGLSEAESVCVLCPAAG